jgi:hypothetical protein
MHENREAPLTPAGSRRAGGRTRCGKSLVYVGGESSDCIVPIEVPEQARGIVGGGHGGKAVGQGDSQAWAGAGHSATEHRSTLTPREDVQAESLGVLISEVGTVCVRSASTGLCGGRRVTVPTATSAETHLGAPGGGMAEGRDESRPGRQGCLRHVATR